MNKALALYLVSTILTLFYALFYYFTTYHTQQTLYTGLISVAIFGGVLFIGSTVILEVDESLEEESVG
ncbi:hypothetical protein B9Q01_04800 [Candidatus Marsarchaeota G1 archaeon OSP_D]|uniref:Uncharacterized protein n=3 Tax=Candidatus Marsarchaeota group 1 TaxID=2203770 RepID=A0A2R6AHZ6_9ARCH|nr:MAG: hypothetical protein B9Q01_04800 [Candidatus Marsarchaeota G1 archaeon OSP_D]PSN85997.1 MAG: hypothetical protein B9Q02_04015 [Candidatus Marsarchaeota G1 archaeon BE_D]PSN88217.1 MAG: hypothetical protein B9Q00_06240 [Candidatus Marsarchaeota G1 archaeon OSP_C]